MQDPLIAQNPVMIDTGVFFCGKEGIHRIYYGNIKQDSDAVFLEFSQWK
jgi:hypothetical protein